MSKYHTTKVFFVALVLLNICSSFFHLYSSKDTPSKDKIHLKGDIIIYAEKNVENPSLSKESINVIHTEGDVIIYNSLKKEATDELPKIVKTTKKVTATKIHKPSIKKTFRKEKANRYFTDFNSNLLINSLLLQHHVSLVIPQNSNSKYAINNAGNTNNVQQVYQKQKIKNYYFSKEILNSFSKKYFGRPPPFLIL